MQKHEARESSGKAYEVFRDTKDGRRIFRAKGTVASSRIYAIETPPAPEPEDFALEEYDPVIKDWFHSETQMSTIKWAYRAMRDAPQRFRVYFPARRAVQGKCDSPGTVTGLRTKSDYSGQRK